MDETKRKSHWNIKPYLAVGLVAFLVLGLSILLFFLVYRYNGFAEGWKTVTGVLQPFIIGFAIAYLINPIMIFFEKYLIKWIGPKMKKKDKAKKLCRSLGAFGALIVFLMIVGALLTMLIPQLVESIQGLMVTLPEDLQNLTRQMDEFLKGNKELAEYATNGITYLTDYISNWATDVFLPRTNEYIGTITSGVIGFVKVIFNILLGLVVAIYLLCSKETFLGQVKKIVYALMSAKKANTTIEIARRSNEIFGGFIRGKIIDSAIIGVLCYILMLIIKLPYPVLVSVIVGATNVIPFFGPFIGAIPSFIIIVLYNPIQGIYFLIMILALQQFDGNILGPFILGDTTGLSPFWVLFAIMVFGDLLGFIGMLLGVPIFAVVYYLCQRIVRHFLRKRKLPEDTEAYIRVDRIDEETGEFAYLTEETKTVKEEKK